MTDIAVETPFDGGSDFAVGDIFGRSFSLFRGDFARFMSLCGIFLLPELLISLALTRPFGSTLTTYQLLAINYGFAFVAVILHGLAAVPIVCGTFARLSGRPLRIATALRDGRRSYASAIGVVVLQFVIAVVGTALLVVPGLIMATIWYVALSVCVVEKRGVIASFGRSAALTKGHRWKFFGILLVTSFGGAAVLIGVQHLLLKLGYPIVSALLLYMMQLLVISFGTVVGTTAYRAVRTAKEGPAIETFAEVFA